MLFSLSFFFVALTYIYLTFAIVLNMFIEFIVRNGPHGGIDSVIVEKKKTTYKTNVFQVLFFYETKNSICLDFSVKYR